MDYYETFAPVTKMVIVQTFFADVAAKLGILSSDDHSTFLHGDLKEEVYMKMPPGFSSTNPGTVCHLHRLLYDLQQSSSILIC